MKIAIIPARIGSKRIFKKNIKNFCGKPIIYWPITALKKTKIFDKIIVSTDDKKIASIARKYKADVPFFRASKLSGDKIGTAKVVVHAIKYLKNKGFTPTYVCCVYPTAAFVKISDIIKGYQKIKNKKWDYVFSASTFTSSVPRSFYKKKNGKIKMLFPKNYYKRSQDFDEVYYDAAQFYWGKTNSWLKFKPIFGKKSTIIDIPRWNAHDIDTIEDWNIAERFWKPKT